MNISKRSAVVGAILAGSTILSAPAAFAQVSGDVIKIGVMNDQSGPYADNGGPGAVEAAKMAIEDFGGEVDGKKIELVIADDQNKPDIGVAIAQKWVDEEGVDAIVGGSASSIAIAIQKMMAKEKEIRYQRPADIVKDLDAYLKSTNYEPIPFARPAKESERAETRTPSGRNAPAAPTGKRPEAPISKRRRRFR